MQRDYSDRKYDVTPYDVGWVNRFLQESEVLRAIFGTNALDIQHIGSTAVLGMAGKPLIDILVTVQNMNIVSVITPKMIKAGYTEYGDLLEKGSLLYSKEQDGTKLVNVHVFMNDHPHVREMLQLRDYLRRHPEEARAYSKLKLSLYKKYSDDYASYRKAKDAYMAGIIERVKSEG